MASEHYACKKEKWKMEDVHRFHRPQQSHTQRQLSTPENGSSNQFSSQRRYHVPSRLLLWVPSMMDGERGQGNNQLHHTFWHLLLRANA
jgi:hypothetical protein